MSGEAIARRAFLETRRFDLRSGWAPGEPTRHRILVDNPSAPYGFGRSA